jgi:molecular chaperone DnaJ
MAEKRDYYEVLGIEKSANRDEIRKAYREAVLKYHPDRVADDQKKEAEEKFKRVSEAYAVLSDANKRSLYDQYGHSGIDQRYTNEDIFRNTDFSSIFENMMGNYGFDINDIFNRNFSDSSTNTNTWTFQSASNRQKGRDLQISIEITLEEAVSGIEKTIAVSRYETCVICSGTGAKLGTEKVICTQCRGAGRTAISKGYFQVTQTCSKCHGKGSIIQTPCSECHGEAVIKVNRTIKVKIPAGISTGMNLRMKNEGEIGSAGKGDLYIVINVKQHSIFQRKGIDILTVANINFTKAILGGEIEISTIDGKVNIKVPAGTQSGDIFRLKEKGIPELHSKRIGDELIKVNVEIPKHLTDEQRKLIEEFERLCK